MKVKLTIFLLLLMTTVILAASCSSEDDSSPMISESKSQAESSDAVQDSLETSVTKPSDTEEPTVHKISPAKAKLMIDQDDVIIVDVRRSDEYAEGHIPSAVLIPNETILDVPPKELPDKNATILVYCRSGRRSAEAAEKLLALGYSHIYDFGGILDWPYEITTD